MESQELATLLYPFRNIFRDFRIVGCGQARPRLGIADINCTLPPLYAKEGRAMLDVFVSRPKHKCMAQQRHLGWSAKLGRRAVVSFLGGEASGGGGQATMFPYRMLLDPIRGQGLMG